MKALLLNTTDIEGGAARAAYRLHRGLQGVGVTSQMLVQSRFSDDTTVVASQSKLGKGVAQLKPTLNSLPLQLYSKRDRTVMISPQWLPDLIASRAAQLSPDIVNLHWLCNGFLQLETLSKLIKPLVWTLHDMWPFTGGCHYSQECDRYTQACGACPQLHSSQSWDLSRWVWRRKARAWRDLNLTIVSPSCWLAKCASHSSVFQGLRVEVIPNGLDMTRYKPVPRPIARALLNLPRDKQLILSGALSVTSDLRKGFHLLQPALKKLSNTKWKDRLELVVFGSLEPSNPANLGFKTHYLGKLNDDISLSLIYAAADVFVAPSIQDNLPNTVMEALACGTPCVAFNIGGMPDLIEPMKNGYLARPLDTEDLAYGITWTMENGERHQKLSDRAREKAEQEFSQDLQARRYLSLFSDLLEEHHSRQHNL